MCFKVAKIPDAVSDPETLLMTHHTLFKRQQSNEDGTWHPVKTFTCLLYGAAALTQV